MRIFSIISIFLLASSCSTEVTNEQLIGKWFALENDSIYTETWFDGEYLLYWNAEGRYPAVYEYQLNTEERTILAFTPPRLDTAFQLEVRIINSNKIELRNEINTWILEPIDRTELTIEANTEPYFNELNERTNSYLRGLNSTPELSTENDRIIFYHLNEQEYDSLAELDDSEGLAEVDSDFGYYASNVLDSMQNTKLKVEVTSERFISVGEQTIDKFEHFGYGVILVKSDSINIQSGVMTDIDYFMQITEFFEL
jgi:hypothetical protein